MKFGCIGEKLGHSFSLLIHRALNLYEYDLMPLAREELPSFFARGEWDGFNVTIPYKKDVIPYLKELSPEAKLCGAVNTVLKKNGEWLGYNTDFSGMKALLERERISLAGKKVLILGSGGTAGTALALCRHLGADAVRVSRTGKDGCLTYPEAMERGDTQILLNTTPCGMFPRMGEAPISLDAFPRLDGVCDAVYNPLKSQLVLDAEKRGIPATGGLYMLVAQGVFAAEIFTGRRDLKDKIEEIYQSILRDRQNVVLVGMPGVGKTTLGKALAEKLGKEFLDSDDWIRKEAAMEIPEIFRLEGENSFRDRESRAIEEISSRQGAVIATGGGAVLRERNLEFLRGNGIILFLDAPPESLVATSDRPLTSNAREMRRRYEERYSKYLAAGKRIAVSRNVEENLNLILKELV